MTPGVFISSLSLANCQECWHLKRSRLNCVHYRILAPRSLVTLEDGFIAKAAFITRNSGDTRLGVEPWHSGTSRFQFPRQHSAAVQSALSGPTGQPIHASWAGDCRLCLGRYLIALWTAME